MIDLHMLRQNQHISVNGYLIIVDVIAQGWRVCIIAPKWPAPMPDAYMGLDPYEVICPTPEKLAATLCCFILFADEQGGAA